MSKGFYVKLALSNLKRNKATYVPYFIAGIGMIFTFMLLKVFAENKDLKNVHGGATLLEILKLGSIVVAIFSVIFIFYTNSFLLKRRKKELGLYAILGLEKKHVLRVLFYESIITIVVTIVCGTIISLIFGKLIFLALLNIISISSTIFFIISVKAIVETALLFVVIYFSTFLVNGIHVQITNPIELLHGEAQGEKVPRTSWIFTILGVITLGIGYAIAIIVKNPISAVTLFLVAVILVIIGTYSLFTAGSIALLKLLKKNKKFYYKTNNFISVSGMIFRMKQNAAGLASICILSTMVLVMVSGTTSLFLGKEQSLRIHFPTDLAIESIKDIDQEKMTDTLLENAKKLNVEVKDIARYKALDIFCIIDKNRVEFVNMNNLTSFSQYNVLSGIRIISLEDLNLIEEEQKDLTENEILIYTDNITLDDETILFGEKEFHIKETLNKKLVGSSNEIIEKTFAVVVKDESVMLEIQKEIEKQTGETEENPFTNYYFCNTTGSKADKLLFDQKISDVLFENFDISGIQSLEMSRDEFYSMEGGLLFLGIFLGTVFLLATVLIIYFKQISEGMVDRSRFEIMQKVGMSNDEVKKTIRKQILMVFFLPLITAILHLAFAFPMICRLLVLFGLLNKLHIFLCTAVCVLFFIVFYTLTYHMTAKVYYKLVHR